MRYSRKLILHCLNEYKPELDTMVAQFVKDGVVFIGVVGKDCSRVEDIVDELVAGDGSDDRPLILTSSHKGKSLEEAIEFAESLTGEYAGEVQVVQI